MDAKPVVRVSKAMDARHAADLDRRSAVIPDPASGADGATFYPANGWNDQRLLLRRTGDAVKERIALLTGMVEAQILPRLVLAHAAPAAPGPARIDGASIGALTRIVLGNDGAGACTFIDALRERGAALDDLYIDLLTPTARRLGELWLEDVCTFADVTIGLGCLHQVLRENGNAFVADERPFRASRRILLAPAPGEHHIFGLTMVAEFFRRAGWSVAHEIGLSRHTLVRIVQAEFFALVGLSIGSGERVEAVGPAVRAIRRGSRNPSVGVMVGGPVLVEHPELASMLGADATAGDARGAVAQAETLLDLLVTPAELAHAAARSTGRSEQGRTRASGGRGRARSA